MRSIPWRKTKTFRKAPLPPVSILFLELSHFLLVWSMRSYPPRNSGTPLTQSEKWFSSDLCRPASLCNSSGQYLLIFVGAPSPHTAFSSLQDNSTQKIREKVNPDIENISGCTVIRKCLLWPVKIDWHRLQSGDSTETCSADHVLVSPWDEQSTILLHLCFPGCWWGAGSIPSSQRHTCFAVPRYRCLTRSWIPSFPLMQSKSLKIRSCLFLHSFPIAGQGHWDFPLRRSYILLVVPAVLPLDMWLSQRLICSSWLNNHHTSPTIRLYLSQTCISATSPSCSADMYPITRAWR